MTSKTITSKYGSIFTLGKTYMEGSFYRSTRAAVRKMFKTKSDILVYSTKDLTLKWDRTYYSASVRRYSNGSISIGCKTFSRRNVMTLRKWALAAK